MPSSVAANPSLVRRARHVRHLAGVSAREAIRRTRARSPQPKRRDAREVEAEGLLGLDQRFELPIVRIAPRRQPTARASSPNAVYIRQRK